MSGQKWLITGASGGLGLALTKKVLDEGHLVVAGVRRPEAIEERARASQGRLIVERLDVTDTMQIQAIARKYQDVDVIVNNAGGAVIGAMEEMSQGDIDQQLGLNLIAPIHVSRAFLPALRARQAGTIVFITSIGGRVGFAGGALYHAAKFGLEGFAETLAQEIAGFGIKTLIIEPGSIKSNFQVNIRWTEESELYRNTAVGQVRRWIQENGEENNSGDPDKMAAAIYGLCQLADPPLRTALGVDAFATLQGAYRGHLKALEAQRGLAESVAIEGKTGFIPE